MEFDRNAPATKGDLTDREARINERYEMLRAEVQPGYNDLRESFRDSQTGLLTAFYSFAQSNNKRFAELEGNEAAIRNRLGTIEDRLMELERRVMTPPPQ
jgi:hypothetical protein